MNMIMQEVLIKVIRSTLYFMDTLNHKFYEFLLIMEENFDCLKAQAPTTNAYDNLSN